MDLLGGYNSDDSSGSEASPAPAVVSKPVKVNSNNPAAIPAGTSAPRQQESKALKKGRRLLRLNAVLPREILDRLAKGASSDTDSDNSDGNSSDNPKKGKRQSAKEAVKMTRKKKPENSATDKGLNSLLTDLNGFAPIENNMRAHKTGAKNEILGMAFMKVSTSVVRKKRDDAPVVDIHGTTVAPSSIEAESVQTKKKQEIIVEDVESDSEPDPEPDQDHSKLSTRDVPVETLPSTGSMKPTRSSSARLQYNVPRPAPIPPSGLSAGMKRPINAVSEVAQHQHLPEQQLGETQLQPPQQQKPTKRSKKELEKALRAGNFDSINEYTQKIDSVNYANPNEHQYLGSSGAGEDSTGGSQFRTSGMERYVPSEGTSVAQSGLSGKMKGKHQIHSLVSNAAKLEADQRRMAAMGTASRGKSNREGAKKKYGW